MPQRTPQSSENDAPTPDPPTATGGPGDEPRDPGPRGAGGDLDSSAGRPRSPDEIDPELMNLRKPRGRIGLVTSAAIVVFCAFLLLRLRHDLAFSRQSETPRTVSTAEIVDGTIGDNAFVQIRAVPDRAFTALLAGKGAEDGNRMNPVLGTGGKLWLVVGGSPWRSVVGHDEVYTGRVRPLDSLPFAGVLRSYVKAQPPAPRYVPAAALKAPLAARGPDGAATIVDASGDPIRLGPDDLVEIGLSTSDAAAIHVVPTDRYPDEATWKTALAAADLPVASVTPEPRGSGWVLRVEAPGALARAEAARAAGALFAARVEPVTLVQRVPLRSLTANATSLAFTADGTVTVPWDRLGYVGLVVPRVIPPGTQVLLTEEVPGNYWYLLPLYVLLGLFALLFVWAFARRLRDTPPATEIISQI